MEQPISKDGELQQYLEQLQLRIGRIENELKRIHGQEQGQEEGLERVREDLKAEVDATAKEVRELNDRLMRIAKESASLVNEFRSCVRQPQQNRLQQRVDAWQGEKYVTRERFKRMLADALEEKNERADEKATKKVST